MQPVQCHDQSQEGPDSIPAEVPLLFTHNAHVPVKFFFNEE